MYAALHRRHPVAADEVVVALLQLDRTAWTSRSLEDRALLDGCHREPPFERRTQPRWCGLRPHRSTLHTKRSVCIRAFTDREVLGGEALRAPPRRGRGACAGCSRLRAPQRLAARAARRARPARETVGGQLHVCERVVHYQVVLPHRQMFLFLEEMMAVL